MNFDDEDHEDQDFDQYNNNWARDTSKGKDADLSKNERQHYLFFSPDQTIP
jgi:hypothetical protein